MRSSSLPIFLFCAPLRSSLRDPLFSSSRLLTLPCALCASLCSVPSFLICEVLSPSAGFLSSSARCFPHLRGFFPHLRGAFPVCGVSCLICEVLSPSAGCLSSLVFLSLVFARSATAGGASRRSATCASSLWCPPTTLWLESLQCGWCVYFTCHAFRGCLSVWLPGVQIAC